jgi:hypothetical protein
MKRPKLRKYIVQIEIELEDRDSFNVIRTVMAFSEDDAMNFVNNDVNFIAEIYILYPEAIGHSVNAAWLEDCNQITSVKSLH